jgi:hypothetical protein
MHDFLRFRKMITPVIVQVLFWIGAAACVLVGLAAIRQGLIAYVSYQQVILGLLFLIAGPLAVRILCELLILLFRMNETLTDIRRRMDTRIPL